MLIVNVRKTIQLWPMAQWFYSRVNESYQMMNGC